jgi:hypothetical protein
MPEVALKFQDRMMIMFNNPNSREEFQTFNRLTPWSSTQQKLTCLRLLPPPTKPQKMSYCAAGLSSSGIFCFYFTWLFWHQRYCTLVLPSCFRRILPKVCERNFAQKYAYWLRIFYLCVCPGVTNQEIINEFSFRKTNWEFYWHM